MKITSKALAVAIAGGMTCAFAAHAGPMTESQSQSFGFPLSPGSTVLEFNQFDDMGGTRVLQKVSIFTEGVIQADVTAENDSLLPAPDFALNISGFMMIDFESLQTVFGYSELFFTDGSVTPTDGIQGSGTDFWDFGTVMASDSGMDMVELPSDLTPFIGAGTIDASVFASGGFSVQGATDSTIVLENFGSTGSVEVVYEFRVIPGAGGLALFGLLGIGSRRRRRC